MSETILTYFKIFLKTISLKEVDLNTNENINETETVTPTTTAVEETKTEEQPPQTESSETSEFTYTSLAHVRPDDLDEAAEVVATPSATIEAPIEQPDRNHQPDSSHQTPAVPEIVTTQTEPTESQFQHQESVERQDETLTTTATTVATKTTPSSDQLVFDEIIDRLRENRISNKDVCNYILNLLVGGEFDLEKNFIIKNVTSILKMIQVIKCANPALKVVYSSIKRIYLIKLMICHVNIGRVMEFIHSYIA